MVRFPVASFQMVPETTRPHFLVLYAASSASCSFVLHFFANSAE